MTAPAIEVIDAGAITLRPTEDQLTAWSKSAGDEPLDAWIVAAANQAAVALAHEERSWPAVIALKTPVTIGARSFTELTMRKGQLKDIKGLRMDGGGLSMDQVMNVAARLCGVPTQVIEALDTEDAGEVMSIALDFYTRCLGAGRTRSR